MLSIVFLKEDASFTVRNGHVAFVEDEAAGPRNAGHAFLANAIASKVSLLFSSPFSAGNDDFVDDDGASFTMDFVFVA